jgi:GxxExxY protein
MSDILLKEESYLLAGICMEVHRELGMGFKEVLYKDAIELELKTKEISFKKEKKIKIEYKGMILPHKFYADFVIFDSIIPGVKSAAFIVNNFVAQTINYLKASGLKPGIIANFREKFFTYKRVIF